MHSSQQVSVRTNISAGTSSGRGRYTGFGHACLLTGRVSLLYDGVEMKRKSFVEDDFISNVDGCLRMIVLISEVNLEII